jgi:hypothetical protein
MSESDIQRAILDWLHWHKVLCWRNNSGAFVLQGETGSRRFFRAGMKGASDIIGCLPDGKFLAIEVKAPKGRVTDEQAQFIADVLRNGGVAFVARGVEDVEREMGETLRRQLQ